MGNCLSNLSDPTKPPAQKTAEVPLEPGQQPTEQEPSAVPKAGDDVPEVKPEGVDLKVDPTQLEGKLDNKQVHSPPTPFAKCFWLV
jgi:hypothetical protein